MVIKCKQAKLPFRKKLWGPEKTINEDFQLRNHQPIEYILTGPIWSLGYFTDDIFMFISYFINQLDWKKLNSIMILNQ